MLQGPGCGSCSPPTNAWPPPPLLCLLQDAGSQQVGFLLGSCGVTLALTTDACQKGLPKAPTGEVATFKGEAPGSQFWLCSGYAFDLVLPSRRSAVPETIPAEAGGSLAEDILVKAFV